MILSAKNLLLMIKSYQTKNSSEENANCTRFDKSLTNNQK